MPSRPELIPTHLEITGGIRTETRNILSFVKRAESEPHILDNALLQRIEKLGRDNSRAVDSYNKQLTLWQLFKLNDQQQIQVSIIEENIQEISEITEQIVKIINNCKGKTIDDILAKDDFVLGIETLVKGLTLDKKLAHIDQFESFDQAIKQWFDSIDKKKR